MPLLSSSPAWGRAQATALMLSVSRMAYAFVAWGGVHTAKLGTPKQPKFPFYLPSPLPPYSYKGSPANSSVASTPARDGFKHPFPPPSPTHSWHGVGRRARGCPPALEWQRTRASGLSTGREPRCPLPPVGGAQRCDDTSAQVDRPQGMDGSSSIFSSAFSREAS